jgi:hypothetical protein
MRQRNLVQTSVNEQLAWPLTPSQYDRQRSFNPSEKRAVEVLIDQEVIRSGAAGAGAAWKFYDLGHGYCTYDFFDQCPHRMVCAKRDFYLPKESGKAQILEAKGNLQRMIQEIPLRKEERAAVEDGLAALERLETKLIDIPTPAGPTPREISKRARVELPIIRQTLLRSDETS